MTPMIACNLKQKKKKKKKKKKEKKKKKKKKKKRKNKKKNFRTMLFKGLVFFADVKRKVVKTHINFT